MPNASLVHHDVIPQTSKLREQPLHLESLMHFEFFRSAVNSSNEAKRKLKHCDVIDADPEYFVHCRIQFLQQSTNTLDRYLYF